MRSMALGWLAVAALSGVVQPARAQQALAHVRMVATDTLRDVAVTQREGGRSVIYYNPELIARVGPLLQEFFIAHEYGHALGLPDLYDRDRTPSEGLGTWCLMAGGSNNNGGATPAFMSAWCRWQLGWVMPERVSFNLRQRELTNATAPSVETDGDSSGPGPVVNRTGGPPASGRNQMFVAPPRFDAWTTPRPSAVKTGESDETDPGSSIARRAGPPSAGTSQISPAIPPDPLTNAICRPSGDQAGLRRKGCTLSLWSSVRASLPSGADVSNSSMPAPFRLK